MRVSNEHILKFLLGGKCECIISNKETKNKFNFKIDAPKGNKSLFFVSTKVDGNNVYAGCIKIKDDSISYTQGAKGVLSENDLPIKALMYVLRKYKTLPDNVEVTHVGKCSRCGRRLTNPESVNTGLGPECMKKVKAVIGGAI